jgi:probable phosphoglycerate mutase
MRRILLARHGETAWNALGRLQGHTDIPLNETGRAQARALADGVAAAGIAAVVTSDLARARETGEIVAAALGLAAPVIEPGLRERRFGVFEGLTRDECATHHPEAWRAWEPPSAASSRQSCMQVLTGFMVLTIERHCLNTIAKQPSRNS